jgi:hypothetical protein
MRSLIFIARIYEIHRIVRKKAVLKIARWRSAMKKCKELLRLKINKKGTAIIALEWDKYLEKLEAQKNEKI